MVTFAAIVTALHLFVYAMTTGSPLASSPPAWEGFWDQSQYVRSAKAFANANLAASEHWYALGYPLLGVPFLTVFPRDPFFLVNTVSLIVFALAFLAYFRPLIGSIATMSAFLVAQLLPLSVDAPHRVNFPVWLQYVIPWNTVPVAALLMVIAVMVRGLRADDSKWKDVAVALLASAVVAIRPSDAIPLLVASAFYFHARVLREGAIAKVGAALVAAFLLLGLYAALSWAIYGGLTTPYHAQVRAIGASMSDFHERAYAILIDAGPTLGEPGAALSVIQPWMLLAMPLALAWAIIDVRRGLLVVGAAAASWAAYISFNDFWPYAVLRLSLIHYVAWTLPVLTAAAVAGAAVAIRRKRWFVLIAALTAAAVLASVDLVATPVAAHVALEPLPNGYTRYEIVCREPQEIDAIDFVGAMASDPHAVTTKGFDVTYDGRPLDVISGYRPVQLSTGLRIAFNRHVEAARMAVALDNTIARQPTEPSLVRALRFELTFAAFRRLRAR